MEREVARAIATPGAPQLSHEQIHRPRLQFSGDWGRLLPGGCDGLLSLGELGLGPSRP